MSGTADVIELRGTTDTDEYRAGYETGHAAGDAVCLGQLFRGAMGMADHVFGRDSRESLGWRGCVTGYMDALPVQAHRGIVCDPNGIIIRFGDGT